MKPTIYIAGPMSGFPDNNYPAFHAAAGALRAQGWRVLNPAENPEPPCGSWLGYMRMSLVQISRCDGMVMLEGWEDSVGATLERQIAYGLGLPILTLEEALVPREVMGS